MSVAVASCTLSEFFSGQAIKASDDSSIYGQLTIPEYQRPYRWTEAEVERFLIDYKQFLIDVKKPSSKFRYYMGSIILHQSKENDRLNIIDGQQRLTTLALISYICSKENIPTGLTYDSPVSQQQIRRNLAWLTNPGSSSEEILSRFDASLINLTVVVTRSEDDAYRFFETQNTGGVRLSGPDIIKAHHLRTIKGWQQDEFASKWESLGDLSPVIGYLIKGRYWQTFGKQVVPSHRQPQRMRDAVVNEFGKKAGTGEDDIAFGRLQRKHLSDGAYLSRHAQQGYEMRQPLNSGINSIHYLEYFEALRVKYLTGNEQKQVDKTTLFEFQEFYHKLIEQIDGCSYLKGLYDTCLLLYISQFGEEQLDVASKKLFRVVYSPRVSNQKAVREASISAFVGKAPVLDWIVVSYTPEQCFDYLDNFHLFIDPANLDPKSNTVKKRYVFSVLEYFGINSKGASTDQNVADLYSKAMDVVLSSQSKKWEKNSAR